MALSNGMSLFWIIALFSPTEALLSRSTGSSLLSDSSHHEHGHGDDALPEHIHWPIGQADILDAIMNVCEQEKSYGTMSLLASISKHHRSIVQPRLKRTKKRIVLDLEDFHFRDKGNDKNIE